VIGHDLAGDRLGVRQRGGACAAGVLLMNPWSGSGKVARFGLVTEAQRRVWGRSFQEFDLGVGALDWAVAVELAQPGYHRGQVLAQAPDEPVPCGKIAGLDSAHPLLQLAAATGGEQLGEGAHVLGQHRQGWAGGEQILQVSALVIRQLGRSGHDPRHQSSRRRSGPFALGAALVQVAHQQVRAAGVALFTNLGQQPSHRHLGFGSQPTM